MISWFAGIFYIWRLFVYHAETNSQEVRDTLSVMERRLYKYIMQPAMISTFIFGFALFGHLWSVYKFSYWIWIKILLAFFVMANHYLADHYRKQFLKGATFTSKRFRILNEVPTVLMILIVILVVVKPF